ncbi:MAG: hypothetical protein M0D55_02190 [Elusimicrobiota bacterium]|nr:MAG: hypothetical protein M0D55_02190 [Elusimicrobiota bacterium]
MAVLLAGCGRDAAEKVYFDSLHGGKNGMSAADQLKLLDEAIALRPDRAWYLERRATLYVDLRDFAKARPNFDRAIELADRAYLRYARALASCQEGRIREALPDFDRAIERQPKNLQFYRGRGLARAETGDLRGARADAAFLLAKVPHWHDGHWLMGRVEELSGRRAAAIPFYEKALSIRPELIFPRRALVRCLRATGKIGEADVQAAEAARRERNASVSYADPFRY